MAGNAQRGTICVDQTTLASEIAEGAGKCMPEIDKTRDDTGRPVCGPEHTWPADRVTSRMTVAMPPVNADELRARLCLFPPKQAPRNPTALCLAYPTPMQRRQQAIPSQPWVEPLVKLHSLCLCICPSVCPSVLPSVSLCLCLSVLSAIFQVDLG